MQKKITFHRQVKRNEDGSVLTYKYQPLLDGKVMVNSLYACKRVQYGHNYTIIYYSMYPYGRRLANSSLEEAKDDIVLYLNNNYPVENPNYFISCRVR